MCLPVGWDGRPPIFSGAGGVGLSAFPTAGGTIAASTGLLSFRSGVHPGGLCCGHPHLGGLSTICLTPCSISTTSRPLWKAREERILGVVVRGFQLLDSRVFHLISSAENQSDGSAQEKDATEISAGLPAAAADVLFGAAGVWSSRRQVLSNRRSSQVLPLPSPQGLLALERPPWTKNVPPGPNPNGLPPPWTHVFPQPPSMFFFLLCHPNRNVMFFCLPLIVVTTFCWFLSLSQTV